MLLDRIMGYNSLHLLVVLALSIFKYYEKGLLEIEKEEEMNDMFLDIKDVNILEIINLFLFFSA
jgi:hypothetical protein